MCFLFWPWKLSPSRHEDQLSSQSVCCVSALTGCIQSLWKPKIKLTFQFYKTESVTRFENCSLFVTKQNRLMGSICGSKGDKNRRLKNLFYIYIYIYIYMCVCVCVCVCVFWDVTPCRMVNSDVSKERSALAFRVTQSTIYEISGFYRPSP